MTPRGRECSGIGIAVGAAARQRQNRASRMTRARPSAAAPNPSRSAALTPDAKPDAGAALKLRHDVRERDGFSRPQRLFQRSLRCTSETS
ncbi:hypothetical protein BSIN_0110 [Burkholderia singularis]|uniref:Uncharacterized protein n=1 Tax=Burkholderia singularis TaxID=1503053 RepID=A0A238H2K9_9BURK|nr:hypothetical protein BSIN_0110 [Burkholderia singularis]